MIRLKTDHAHRCDARSRWRRARARRTTATTIDDDSRRASRLERRQLHLREDRDLARRRQGRLLDDPRRHVRRPSCTASRTTRCRRSTRPGLNAGLAPIAGECEDNEPWDIVVDAEKQRPRDRQPLVHATSNITPENAAHEVADGQDDRSTRTSTTRSSFFVFPYDFFTAATIAQTSMRRPHRRARRQPRRQRRLRHAADQRRRAGATTCEVGVRRLAAQLLEVRAVLPPRTCSTSTSTTPSSAAAARCASSTASSPDGARREPSRASARSPLTHLREAPRLPGATPGDKGLVWTAPPSTIVRYRHARTACKASVSGDMITFDTSNADCTKYATPISVIVTTRERRTARRRHAGRHAGVDPQARRRAGSASPPIRPRATSRSPAARTAGHEIDPGIQTPARADAGQVGVRDRDRHGHGLTGQDGQPRARRPSSSRCCPTRRRPTAAPAAGRGTRRPRRSAIVPTAPTRSLHYRGTGLDALDRRHARLPRRQRRRHLLRRQPLPGHPLPHQGQRRRHRRPQRQGRRQPRHRRDPVARLTAAI